jgi:FixJ family two-component response regulator
MLPRIFLTAHGDIPLVVGTMRSGSDGFLAKPCEPERLIAELARLAIRAGIEAAG